jgi:g-D-glutamyl-meso-diaminopimelate peptidase
MDIIEKIFKFYNQTNFKKGYIGKTESGKRIPYIFVGKKNKPTILAVYTVHAREYITSLLCLKQIEYLSSKDIDFGIYFIPVLNIDGVELATNNLQNISEDKHNFLNKINGSNDFSLFKANINCVDLNVNFDADWGCGISNVDYPLSANYIGQKPFSEKETKSLRDFTLKTKPDITISYHSKGEEIYWFYGQKEYKARDYRLGKNISETTGYPLKYSFGSSGGYKDWCIQKIKIPSFTIEVGNDNLSHPIKEDHLSEIFDKNKDVFINLAKAYKIEFNTT